MATVLVVDDHSVVRMGLISLLSGAPGLTVVGQAAKLSEAMEKARAFRPDVVLMGARLPDGTGIEGCRMIREQLPDTKVLILTASDDKDTAMAAVMAGAWGYLLKQAEPEEILQAVKLAVEGTSLLDPAITRGVLEHLRTSGTAAAGENKLTERERSILALLGEGLTNREIGTRLFLSEKTVRNYVSLILQKLGLSNRSQAAAYVSRRRLLGP